LALGGGTWHLALGIRLFVAAAFTILSY